MLSSKSCGNFSDRRLGKKAHYILMRVSEIQQVLLVSSVVFLQAGSVLRSHRQVNLGFRAFLFVSKLCMPEVFNYQKKKFSLAFTFIFCTQGKGRGPDETETYFFFLPMDIFYFTVSNFERLYSSLFPCLLEERSGTFKSVLISIDFKTEGSQYLEFIFLQLFSLFEIVATFCA